MSTSPLPYERVGENQIRLIRLLPGAEDDPLSLQILPPVSLDNILSYHALSYVWGDPNTTKLATIEGVVFPIRANLADFLQCYRRDLRRRIDTLWVDAICIDQTNNEEKRAQIPLMRQIYERASITLIWLGLDRPEFEKGWELISRLPPADFQNGMIHGPMDTKLGEWMKVEENKELARDCWYSFNRIISLPWFTRVWIKQEYIISTAIEVRCGSRQLSLLDFYPAGWNLFQTEAFGAVIPQLEHVEPGHPWGEKDRDNHSKSMSSITALVKSRNLRHKYIEIPLLRLLCEYRDSDATNPRDKVYGILGLQRAVDLNQGGRAALEGIGYDPRLLITDYNAPLGSVYGSVVQAIVAVTQSLNILSACQPRGNIGVPSWAPDWSMYWNSARWLLEEHVRYYPPAPSAYDFKASGTSIPVIKFSGKAGRLHVTGMVVDRINETWPALPQAPGNGLEDLRRFQEYRARAILWCDGDQSKRYHAVDKGSINALWQSLNILQARDFIGGGQSPDEQQRDEEIFHDWIRNDRIHLSMVMRIRVTMMTRRTLTGEKGYLISGPESALPGDVVCVLLGCDIPVVLRQVAEHYVLVGECYCQGIMRGEIMKALGSGDSSMVIFEVL